MDLVTTYTDEDYNCYASLDDIDAAVAFISAPYGTDFGFAAMADSVRGDLAIMGSRSLSQTLFRGVKNTGIINRFMVFPRTGLYYNPDGTNAVGATEIPVEIVNYVATWILQRLYRNKIDGKNLTSKTVDGVSETYDRSDRSMLVDDLDPLKQIPSYWLYTSMISDLHGVGSIGKRRIP